MQYDFDEVIERRGTGALKYEALLPRWGRDDLIPLWVADMDFRTPPFIMEAIRRRCEHEILGYTVKPRAFFEAIRDWVDRRHGWKVNASEIGFAPGIVPGISSAIQCFTEPGDKIMIQPPVYHPFAMIIRENGREIVNNPLILENGRYRMDFNHMKEAVRGCRMFILCNPHNPGGRVWSPEELRCVAEICTANGTLVVSDEIHADLTLPGHRHTVFATVSEQARMNSVTYMAPSKTFNVPGLGSSYVICQNPDLFAKYQDFVSGRELAEGHVFAYDGLISAYSGPEGEEWLAQALDYIQENIRFIDAELRRRMPKIKAIMPDASYLVFLDCRELNLSQKELVAFFVDGARLALNDGSIFGKEGEGFMRLNAGCPRSILERALSQLEEAYENRGFRQQQSQN